MVKILSKRFYFYPRKWTWHTVFGQSQSRRGQVAPGCWPHILHERRSLGDNAWAGLRPYFHSIIPASSCKSGTIGWTTQRRDAIFVREHTTYFYTLHRIPQVNQIVIISAKNHSPRHLKIRLKLVSQKFDHSPKNL